MARFLAPLACALILVACFGALIGPSEAAYEQQKKFWVWPEPVNYTIGESAAWLDRYNFNFKFTSNSFQHDILNQAFGRYSASIGQNQGQMVIIDWPQMAPPPAAEFSSQLRSMSVTVNTKVETLELGTDESYSLNITGTSAVLVAETIFGALRGLETFQQLVQWNGTVHLIPYLPIVISDAPMWPWRGILIDTARHYQSVAYLEKIIDSLVLAKYNVFHWHLTDAESFPVVLPSNPEFSDKGAWSSNAKYTVQDIQHITQYALYRGMRVVPEIDTPGHTYSFGKSHPEMIVNCTDVMGASLGSFPKINDACLNMTNDAIYPLLSNIYSDIAKLFPDQFIHVGGDEVQTDCLDEFPAIIEWMEAHGMDASTYNPLLSYFRQKLTPMITDHGKKMVVWQEALQEMLPLGSQNPLLPNNTVVQLWIKDGYQAILKQSILNGYQTLMSGGWYLDQQIPKPNPYVPNTNNSMIYTYMTHYLDIDTWLDMYNVNPLAGLGLTPEQEKLFIGGEAAQWAEAVMGEGILTNIWPRAAAAAERLWVGPRSVGKTAPAYHRFIRFQCYLYQRGVPTSGVRPSYCTSSVFDPPYMAGGLTIPMPVWALIILVALAAVLLLSTVVLSVQAIQRYRKDKAGYSGLVSGDTE